MHGALPWTWPRLAIAASLAARTIRAIHSNQKTLSGFATLSHEYAGEGRLQSHEGYRRLMNAALAPELPGRGSG